MIKAIYKGIKGIDVNKINQVIKYFLVCVFAFIISRGTILGYAPMTISCYICVVNQKRIRFLVLLSLMAGIISNNSSNAIKYLLILVILSTFIYMFDFFKIKVNNLIFIGVITTFVITYSLPVYLNNNPYGLVGALGEGLAVLILSILFKSGFENLLMDRKDHYVEVAISISVITFSIIIGLYGIKWVDFSLVNTIVLALLIQVGYQYGLEIGSIFSMIVAFSFYYIYQNHNYFIIYMVVGIVSGIFRRLNKIGCLLASISVYVGLMNLYENSDMLSLVKSVIIASSIYMLIPYTEKEEELKSTSIKDRLIKENLDKTALAYANLARMFEKISKRKDGITKEEIDQLIDDVASRVCLSCSMCKTCWKKNFYSTYRTVYSVLEELENKGQVYIKDIPEKFYDNCIKADEFVRMINKMYELYKTDLKWENKLNECRELFSEQFTTVAHRIIDLSDEIEKYNENDHTLNKRTIKYLRDNQYKIDRSLVYKDVDGKHRMVITVDKHHTGSIYDMIEEINHHQSIKYSLQSEQEIGDIVEYTLVEQAAFKIIKGVAKRSRGEVKISGDNHTFIDLDTKEIIALSDGMGSGVRAYKDSETAIEVLDQLSSGGFKLDIILKTINALLSIKNDYESFATMDVSMIDKYSGDCTMIKNGAVSTYIKRGNEIDTIRGESLPFGIVKKVDYKTNTRVLEANDMVVMLSDGIIEDKENDSDNEIDKEHLLIEYLKKTEILNPQRMANDILRIGKEKQNTNYDDDMTVIVFRVIKAN